MNYDQERGKFIEIMRQEGMTQREAELILRHAATIERLAVARCNRELSEEEERKDERMEEIIKGICKNHGIKANFNGDPRGYTTKLILKSGRYNTWGGQESGYGVPTRNY